jgi:hypothetical protein
MTTLEDVKAKAQEIFDESPFNGWDDVFDELDGELVDEEFIEEHRWYSLFERVYKVGDNYFRVPIESGAGDGDYDQECNPDDVEQVYPKEVTKTVYTTNPN